VLFLKRIRHFKETRAKTGRKRTSHAKKIQKFPLPPKGRFWIESFPMKKSLLVPLALGLAILSLAAVPGRAEEISGVTSEYVLAVSKNAELKLDFSWPERFGRQISTVALNALDLRKAEVKPVDGGAMNGYWIVTIPTRGNAKAVKVEAWGKRADEVFPKNPDRTFQCAELFFHCPSKADARKVLSDLQKTGQ